MKAEDVKRQAAGQWRPILQAAGLSWEQTQPGYRGPCPKCGGRDRFSTLKDIVETGGLWCRNCHHSKTLPKSGDGFAAVQWLRDCSFREALEFVAGDLHSSSSGASESPATPAVGTGGAKLHDSLEAAAGALAWSLQKQGTLPEKRQPDSVWRYHDSGGEVVGAVCRWNTPGGKEIRQLRQERGGWVCRAMEAPRRLYRLPELLAADAESVVHIVEGEKAADAGQSLGLVCVTSAGGSNASEQTDWQPVAGRSVVICPDHDEPGQKYAKVVAQLCRAAGATSVKLLHLPDIWPDCPPGGDLADFSESHDSKPAEDLRAAVEAGPVELVELPAEDEAEALAAVQLFEVVDSAAFAVAEYPQTFLIEDVLLAGQPQLWGGPSKTLKTSLLVDQCLSLAASVPFLGRYQVPQPVRVLLLSSESGTATLQETARRISKAKGIDLAALGDRLQWGFRPPVLTESEHLAALTQFVRMGEFDVVAIDPAYLSLPMDAGEAANQFAVGQLLQKLTTLQAETGALPVLAAHFRKSNLPGVKPELSDVAGAGFGQWARQWFLLNREEKFDPENPGVHKLLASWGGSAGHCGGLVIHIDEGRREHGRSWNVQLLNQSQRQADIADEKEQRKREKQAETEERNRWKVLQTLRKFPHGETETKIRQAAGLNPTYFAPVWLDLQQSGEVEPVQIERGKTTTGKPRYSDGWKLIERADRLKEHKEQ